MLELLVLFGRDERAKRWRSSFFDMNCRCSGAGSLAPALQAADRAVLAALTQVLPRAHQRSFPVQPATLLRWHRELVRRPLDLPAPAARPSATGGTDTTARPAPRGGESDLGIQADPRRARRTRHSAVAQQRLEHPSPPRHQSESRRWEQPRAPRPPARPTRRPAPRVQTRRLRHVRSDHWYPLRSRARRRSNLTHRRPPQPEPKDDPRRP